LVFVIRTKFNFTFSVFFHSKQYFIQNKQDSQVKTKTIQKQKQIKWKSENSTRPRRAQEYTKEEGGQALKRLLFFLTYATTPP